MQFFASTSRGRFHILALLSLAFVLALPLAARADEHGVFVSIRSYAGIDPNDMSEIVQRTENGFLPIISGVDGFIGYYLLPAYDELLSINLFESAAAASASNAAAADFVAAQLAPLLPNPPQVFEGAVEIAFVELLDGTGVGNVNTLHASVRLYEGFEADSLAAFVSIVEDGFLPIMRATDGFFGYYLMTDGADTVAAISIFDSERSALASNIAAADFVAENLTQYLPSDPSVTAGRVGIASLAEIIDGKNLIDDHPFASVRVYDGVDPADHAEIARIVNAGFLPIMSGSDGFVGYYLLPAEDKVAAVSIFETAELAARSTEAARDFVADNLAPLLPNPPTVFEAPLDVMYLATAGDMTTLSPGSLYAALRLYDNYDLTRREEAVDLGATIFLPQQQAAGGLFSYFTMDDGVDRLVALTVYDSEASAHTANELAADFAAEYMSDWAREEPTRLNGRVSVAAFASLNDGANLIEDRVFASVRVYDGLDPDGQDGLYLRTAEEFLDLIRNDDGFIGYYWLHAGEKVVTISVFDTEEKATASSAAASQYIEENLADVVPAPPHVVEGAVDIAFVELLDGTGAGNVNTLHASVRLYEGFEADDLAEFVSIVEDGFLPIMRATDGFFGYYLMTDGADTLAAISIFDSEQAALASNIAAADFVAENLTQYLPSDPSVTAGRVGIASLADLHDGANLIDDRAFASVRVYDGVDPADHAEITRRVNAGFLPIMRGSDGFIAYLLLPAGDRLAAVSVFTTAEQAAASNDAAKEFVAEALAPLLPNPPLILQGGTDTVYFAPLDQMQTSHQVESLYASLRLYDDVDVSQQAESNALVNRIFLPILQETAGFWGYLRSGDGIGRRAALSIFDNEENALAANDEAAAFVAEYLTDRTDEAPIRLNGRLGVAALADVDMGANLVGEGVSDEGVFASVRLYDGVDPADQAEIVRLTDAGFLPIMRESAGFVGYYFLPAADMLATISLFDSADRAAASADAARDFIAENLAPLFPNPPRIYEGQLSISAVDALGDATDDVEVSELFASIRFYEGFDLHYFDEANDLAIAHLLPALRGLGGLFAQYAFNDGADTVVGISIFDSEEASLAANEVGKAFTAEHLAEWAPNPPSGVAGKLALAALADASMGANLAVWEPA